MIKVLFKGAHSISNNFTSLVLGLRAKIKRIRFVGVLGLRTRTTWTSHVGQVQMYVSTSCCVLNQICLPEVKFLHSFFELQLRSLQVRFVQDS